MSSSIAIVALAAATSSRAQSPSAPAMHGSAPSISPDGLKIAFLSERGGATDVFLIAADGTGETRLTNTPEDENQPGWPADGGEIWFSVFADGASRIYSIGLDGKDRKLLGTVPGRALRMSPDGKRILYWTGTWTAMKMFAANLDGSGAKQLTDGSGVVWGARWSPDGKRIAFADKDAKGNLHVFVIEADGSDRRQVTGLENADVREQMPAWSPDRAKLAVQAGAKNEPAHIWIVDVATGAGRKLAAHTEPYQDEVPAWFPDGKRLAFQSDRTGRMEIWVMNADGTQPRQITK
jgi:Tol biopolymer transport system component